MGWLVGQAGIRSQDRGKSVVWGPSRAEDFKQGPTGCFRVLGFSWV